MRLSLFGVFLARRNIILSVAYLYSPGSPPYIFYAAQSALSRFGVGWRGEMTVVSAFVHGSFVRLSWGDS